MEEFRRDVKEYHPRRIAMTDNLINGNPKQFKELCCALIDAKLNIEIFGSLALLPSVDDDMLDLMQGTGFVDVLLAVETPAVRVRKDMGKWTDLTGVMRIVRGAARRGMTPYVYLMHSFPTEREEDFRELLHFVDEFDPGDFGGVGTWPFRLAQVQPGEIDMAFVRRFNIQLLDGDGHDTHNPRVAFGKEPKWCTEFVSDEIKIERHQRVTEHLKAWSPPPAPKPYTVFGKAAYQIDQTVSKLTGWTPKLHYRGGIVKSKIKSLMNTTGNAS